MSVVLLASLLIATGLILVGAASASASWDLSDCAACHATYPDAHSLDNCYACHNDYTDPDIPHNPATQTAPAGDCIGCHDVEVRVVFGVDPYEHGYYLANGLPWSYWPESPLSFYDGSVRNGYLGTAFTCDYCHSDAFPHIYQHDATALEAAHLTSTPCTDCHSASLSTEHADDCAACHSSTDPVVIGAISAGDTSCEACHTIPTGHYQSPKYVTWGEVLARGTGGAYNTPHKGYATTTTLCAVCHSVHYAPVYDGSNYTTYEEAVAAWDGGAGARAWAEKLLPTSAGNSCSYCHIETSIGGIQIYGGDASLYGTTQNFTNSFAHDYHGGADEGCLVCHAVHGANTYDGAVGGKILLKEPRGRAPQPETIGELANSIDPTTGQPNTIEPVYATLEDAYTDGTDRFAQQVPFCTSCHYTYSDDSTTAHARRGGTQFVKSHPMVEATGSTVALVGSGTCRSCHDAGGVNQYKGAIGEAIDNIPATGYSSNNFPHYTAGNYRFLDQGDLGMENKIDVSCLKCHQDAGNDWGVGFDF